MTDRADTDLLAVVRESVWEREAVDSREASSRQLILDALDTLAAPFERDADPTHVTGSALIVGPRGIVLHRHKRLGLWLQPGGHLEAGETPWAAARREAAEETGLSLVWAEVDSSGRPPLAHLDVHDGGRGHTHLDLRYLLAVAVAVGGGDEPEPPPGESQEVRWYAWPDALAVADPGLAGWLRDRSPAMP